MTIKQKINQGIIKKVCHLHSGIFHPNHLCHTPTTPLPHSPVSLSTKTHEPWNERKGDLPHPRILQRFTLYQRRYKILSLDAIAFSDTHICIDNPY